MRKALDFESRDYHLIERYEEEQEEEYQEEEYLIELGFHVIREPERGICYGNI